MTQGRCLSFGVGVGAILVMNLAAACKEDPLPVQVPPGDSNTPQATPPDPTDPMNDDPHLQAIAARLPEGWSGTGVLEQRKSAPPSAPAWVRVVAEIIEQDGKRYLRATGIAPRIKNTALARTAAGNRARAELVRWIGFQRLVGSEITDHWGIPGQATYARARIPVPVAWQPGQRLSVDPDPPGQPGTATP